MPTWTIVYSVAFWPLLVLVCGSSIVRGRQPLRSSAAAFLVAMVGGQLTLSQTIYAKLEIGLAIADLTLLVALTCFSIRWPRWWLALLSAIQIVTVLGHLARWLSTPFSRLTYAILTGGGTYLQLALLALALSMPGERRGHRASRWPDDTPVGTGRR